MTSCTATFQEDSADVGDYIHADFKWTDAVYRGFPYYHYAVMWIEDPSGNPRVNYVELGNATDSRMLEFKTDMAGTWTCRIEAWQGAWYVIDTDTVPVSEPATSCTATFQEDSADVGDYIHADFTWENAIYRGIPYLHYAWMWIKDPTGTTRANYTALIDATGSWQLEFKTDMAGTWTCEIQAWQGFMYVVDTDTVPVGEEVTSCTATFQEESVIEGATIHADFTWENAIYRGIPYYHYAVMWIEDPSGNPRVNYVELGNATDSRMLEFKTDMPGIWKCRIDVWQGAWYVTCTDTVDVSEMGDRYLIAFSIDPNPVDKGKNTTVYVTGQNIGDIGEYFRIDIWSEQHGTAYSDWVYRYPGGTFSWSRVLSNVQYTQDCQVIIQKWYEEPVDEEWDTINVLGCIAGIWDGQSSFNKGPFPPNTRQLLAKVVVQNLSDYDGCWMNIKFAEYPGTPKEERLPFMPPFPLILDARKSITLYFNYTTPTETGEWPLGCKVWAADEKEPPWGALGTKIFNSTIKI